MTVLFDLVSFGSKKGDELNTYNQTRQTTTTTIMPYAYYNPVQTYAPSTAYSYQGASYIIDSPMAVMSKKGEAIAQAEPDVSNVATPSLTQNPATGAQSGASPLNIDMSALLPMLLVVGVGGVILYLLLVGGKK